MSSLGRIVYGARVSLVAPPAVPILFRVAVGAGVSSEADLSSFVDRVRDQRTENKCVGEAFTAALHVSSEGKGARGSALGLYTLARVRERARATDPIPDLGCQPADAVGAAQEWGIYPEDDRDDDPAMVSLEETWDELRASRIVPAGVLRPIVDVGAARCAALRASIGMGQACVYRQPCDASYEAYDGSGIWTGLTGPVLGQHQQAIVGFGVGYFLVLGSWGQGFGRSGYALVGDDFMGSVDVGDAYAVAGGVGL